jgi:hypothetical protein
MTIHRVLADHSFDPDDVAVLVKAYEDALRNLGLTTHEDAATLTVAKRILELAKVGMLDPDRLRDVAVASLLISAQQRATIPNP